MLFALFIVFAIVALFWAILLILPSTRSLPAFLYSSETSPEALNGCFPRDDVQGATEPDPAQWPQVTIIVPGRNEGHVLAKTLGSLCALDYPNYRIIFVDDQSTDNTAAVCRELAGKYPNLTIVHNTQAPSDGWVGKSWAVHQAAAYMNEGDFLLFTDADLEFHPQCLKQMIRLARHRNSDIASLLPSIYYKTLGELLGLLPAMTLINIGRSLRACNNPKNKKTLVAGGFMLVKREVYHAIGGHAAVRGQMVEDVALGMRAKALGRRVFTAATQDLYRARMYEGWGDTFRGLKKNAYAGANYSPALGVVIIAFLLFFCVLPPLYVLIGLFYWITLPSLVTFAVAASAIIALVAEIAMGMRNARFVGWRDWTAYTLPAGFFFYLLLFIGSIKDYYGGGNHWSGRRIAKAETLADAGNVGPPTRPVPETPLAPQTPPSSLPPT